MNETKYCTECGIKMALHHNGSYDQYTGKPNMSFHCTNLKCEDGCGHAGHVYSWFFAQTCSRCGYNVNHHDY